MKLVIYGTSSFSELMHRYFTNDSDYEVVAFTVDAPYKDRESFCGKPVHDFDTIVDRCPPESHRMFVSYGYRVMRNRRALFAKAKTAGYELANFIHPSVNRENDFRTGQNNVLFPNVLVEPHARLGDNNFIWSNTLVGHNVTVGHHNFISGGVILSGKCRVDSLCFLGVGSIIIDGVHVADESHIVPGSVVFQDTAAHTKYTGSPARPLLKHEDTGIVIQKP